MLSLFLFPQLTTLTKMKLIQRTSTIIKEKLTAINLLCLFHFVRFGEALRITQDNLNAKNFYAFNPAFDK